MSEHGFLQPNPALFELENRKKKAGLAHELGAGAECLKCGRECSGFQLHFWRKVCVNCRCGKAEHAVTEDSDHGAHFVGRIFDRPLRSRAEECTFIYGEVVEEGREEEGMTGKEVTLAWAPPGVPSLLASRYLRSLPQEHLSIQGSEGAQRRLAQLERQFPLHDVEPGQCHQLSRGEIDSMSSYVDNVKKNVVGQGIVQELASPPRTRREEAEMLARESTPSPPPPLPPPPMELLETDRLSYTLGSPLDLQPPRTVGTYYAQPYRGGHAGLATPVLGSSLPPPPSHLLGSAGSSMGRGGSTGSSMGRGGSTGSSPASTSPSPPHCSPTPHHQGRISRAWSCSGCSQPMLPGAVAVFAERAGKDRCWHPNCFRCSTCGDRLEDLLYFYSKGQLFCGRDFALLMNIPRCVACDELIFSTEYTGAEGGAWHLKHFCCWECDAPLAGHKYIAEAGQPHCLPCWQHHHGKVCSSCGQVIDPQGQRVSLGDQHWHATTECFRCGVCDQSLLGGKMSKRGNTLLCSAECGQQLALLKQQQASLLNSSSSSLLPSSRPSGSSRSSSSSLLNSTTSLDRSSPVPGLVPGLAKLTVQDPQRKGYSPRQEPLHQRQGSNPSLHNQRQGSSPSPLHQRQGSSPRPGSASSWDPLRAESRELGSPLPPPPAQPLPGGQHSRSASYSRDLGSPLPPPPAQLHAGGQHARSASYSTIV